MFFRDLVIGIVTIVIGIAFCFSGYRFFRVLIAIWGFLAGFLFTSQVFTAYSGGHFLASVVGLILAVIGGLIVAALAYYLYVAAVVILGASVGFWLGTGLLAVFGYSSSGTLALVVGVIFAVLLAWLTLALNLTQILIIISTSLGGSATIIAGVMLLLGRIPLASLSSGVIGAIIKGSLLWGLACLVLALIGMMAQWSNTRRYVQGYAQSQF
jgi:Domain of unknown function (DUF4203)